MLNGKQHNYGKQKFVINAIGDEVRNRQLQVFDVFTYLASKSPLQNVRTSKKTGEEKVTPLFENIQRVRDVVNSEPTNLFAKDLANLETLMTSGHCTPEMARKLLFNFGSTASAQLDKHRYGMGLEIHHRGPSAAIALASEHLPIVGQGDFLSRLSKKANTGNTYVTQDYVALNNAEHNAAHFALVPGVAFKGDVKRNLGNMESLVGEELVDHFVEYSANPNAQLADNAEAFAQETRERYVEKLKERGVKANAAELGSAIVRPGDTISSSRRIFEDTLKSFGAIPGDSLEAKASQRFAKGCMKVLTDEIEKAAYPLGYQSIIPNAEKTKFTTSAQIGKRLGQDERKNIDKLRENAVATNTEGVKLHPGSWEELPESINLRNLIEMFGIKNN